MTDVSGKERTPQNGKDYLFLALKTTISDLNGKDWPAFVTLGALPDINNPNWKQTKNIESLKQIYDSLQVGEDMEIEGELNPLTGIRTI